VFQNSNLPKLVNFSNIRYKQTPSYLLTFQPKEIRTEKDGEEEVEKLYDCLSKSSLLRLYLWLVKRQKVVLFVMKLEIISFYLFNKGAEKH
jgi:hypothetical protein